MTSKQFFNSRACTVDMNTMSHDKPIINEDDIIICVEYMKNSYPFYMVYYLSNIYQDDRQYKCRARFNILPSNVAHWIENKQFTENAIMKRWC